ncbi:MAG: NAD+ synthase [Alteromonadaceae bacterium]|nr:MAG: NAD+ synthase [Alteromonadaceae bacterium]
MPTLNITMVQINPHVGDITGNCEQMALNITRALSEHSCDVVVFPELTLTGYPPEDLLLRPSLEVRVTRAIEQLAQQFPDVYVVLGYPRSVGGKLYNMAGVLFGGKLLCEYAKQCLPNYQVFDEKRYFHAGDSPQTFKVAGVAVGLTICEDMWDGQPVAQSKASGAELMLNLNASPFHRDKQAQREGLLAQRAKDHEMSIVYVNQIGGQDELVFDGASMACNADGSLVVRAKRFEEDLVHLCYDTQTQSLQSAPPRQVSQVSDPESVDMVYRALVLGVKDYVNKNGFKGIVLGLSGGIDSALTLAIAVDALGASRVRAVMMPFRYTSDMSKSDAQQQADVMGVHYQSISIEPMYEAFMVSLEDSFKGTEVDTTEQNIQARSRGVVLMALSNKLGYLVLTTGNKSEMAVGYATLYGDMAGGLDVLKDVPKTLVFTLAKYRNRDAEVIPKRVIERPPSAELAPDQKDEDSLPPYDDLDQILEYYIEHDLSCDDIVAKGFEGDVVKKVLRLVDINEYKRRQAPIGIRVSERAFGRDRRYPITNGWKLGA